MTRASATGWWARVARVAIAAALSAGLFAGGMVAAPAAGATTKSFSSYKYGSCNAYKSNAAAYISAQGSVTLSSNKREITINKFTGNFISFRCNTQYHSSVDRMRTGIKFIAYGGSIQNATVGWNTGYSEITATKVESKYYWGSWRNNTANTVTTAENGYVKGTGSTLFNWIYLLARGEIEHGGTKYSLTTKATVGW